METHGTLTRGQRWLPAGLAALLAVTVVAGAWATRRSLQNDRSQGARVVAAAGADAIAARLQTQATVLALAAQQMGDISHQSTAQVRAGLAALDTTASAGLIGYAPVTGTTVDLVATAPASAPPVPLGSDLASRPEWRLALDLARDGGQARAAASASGAGPVVLVAVALYRSGTAPVSVHDRRANLAGYLVAVATPGQLTGPGLATLGNHFAGRLTQDVLELESFRGGAGRPPSSTVAAPVNADGVTWSLLVWPRHASSALPWTLLSVGLILALAVGLAAGMTARSSLRLARLAVARADELGLVARTGPLLQQSLELGDLLPLFVVELSDDLHLDGVAVNLVSDTGHLVRAFSFGTTTGGVPDDPTKLPRVPVAVKPGDQVTVPLQRAGRIVGVLTARARNGLEHSQVQTLQAVCDLLAAALGNARLFQREQDMVKRLRDLDRMKTTFLGSVSHELRTSVTAIAGFADLLSGQQANFDQQSQADFLDRISRNAKSLGLLVDDLLDFARLERSAMAVILQPVDLSDLIPKVIGQMSSILHEHTVSDTLTQGVVAVADPAAVERILVNLLSNAAKYTPPGTEVHIGLGQEGSNAVLSVSDRGPGIAAEERERIFDQFYRVDTASTRSARGVGIGLALVRQLVDLQHGTVTADETPGGGATFRVELPLAERESDTDGRPVQQARPR